MIDGIPEGWELVRIGNPQTGEWMLDSHGEPRQVRLPVYGFRAIVRKVERPKTYRPFANAAEFEPHRDRWCRIGDCDSRVQNVTNERVYFRYSKFTWEQAYIEITFDDGTPFGVEVSE